MYRAGRFHCFKSKESISPPSRCCFPLPSYSVLSNFTTQGFTKSYIVAHLTLSWWREWNEMKERGQQMDGPVTSHWVLSWPSSLCPCPIIFAILLFQQGPFSFLIHNISGCLPFPFRLCAWLCRCLTLPFLCTLCPCIPGNRWYHLVQSRDQGLVHGGGCLCVILTWGVGVQSL